MAPPFKKWARPILHLACLSYANSGDSARSRDGHMQPMFSFADHAPKSNKDLKTARKRLETRPFLLPNTAGFHKPKCKNANFCWLTPCRIPTLGSRPNKKSRQEESSSGSNWSCDQSLELSSNPNLLPHFRFLPWVKGFGLGRVGYRI